MGMDKGQVRRRGAAIVLIGLVAGCGGSTSQPDDSSGGSATSAPAESSTPTSEPPDTTTPPQPLDIADTLVQPDEETVVGILQTGTDPSPIDGDAVPPRPDAHCAVATNNGQEVTGCEFDSADDASQYSEQWNEAIAQATPRWHAQDATTTPIDSVPGWSGRVVSGKAARYEDLYPVHRADLVQQRGRRVYTVTVITDEGGVDAAIADATTLADAQQQQLDDMGITDTTPGFDGDEDADHVSVRYLTPTWAELQALAPDMTGVPEEYTYAWRSEDDYHLSSETYYRAVTTEEKDDWGYPDRFEVSVTRSDDPGAAVRSVLYDTGMRCARPAAPIDGLENGVSCETDDDFTFGASYGPYALTMWIPNNIDFNSAQALFVKWNNEFLDRGLPTDASVPVRDAAPRTANPLPTDSFPIDGYDGSYLRGGVGSSVEDGEYVSAGSWYDRTPGIGGPAYLDDKYSVLVVRADSEIENTVRDAELVGSIGEVTADAWTTVFWKGYVSSDGTNYEGRMARLLPSGDRLEVSDNSMFVVGGVEPDPPFKADGPLLTSVWESLQDFSLDDFTADPDEVVEVRNLAGMVALVGDLTSQGGPIVALEAGVADDSPPGTNAEWRLTWQVPERSDQPDAARRLIAFEDEGAATEFASTVADGVELTPIADAPEVAGGSNAESGLIVIQRGKWVLTVSSPGRTRWNTSTSVAVEPIGIEQFTTFLAQYFVSTGLT